MLCDSSDACRAGRTSRPCACTRDSDTGSNAEPSYDDAEAWSCGYRDDGGAAWTCDWYDAVAPRAPYSLSSSSSDDAELGGGMYDPYSPAALYSLGGASCCETGSLDC